MNIKDLTKLDELTFRKMAFEPGYHDVLRPCFAYLLQTCSREEINEIWGCYFLAEREDAGSSLEQARTLIGSLKSDWYELCTKNGVRIVQRGKLLEELAALAENEPAGIREVFPAECSGHVHYTMDGRIFIEAFRGGIQGLSEALAMPSYYVIDGSGTCCSKYESAVSGYYVFDANRGEWTLCTSQEPQTLALSGEQLDVLQRLLGKINLNRIYMKLEWAYSGSAFHITDCILPMGNGAAE